VQLKTVMGAPGLCLRRLVGTSLEGNPSAFSLRANSVGTHILATSAGGANNRMDARVEPAHNELGRRFRGEEEKNEGPTP